MNCIITIRQFIMLSLLTLLFFSLIIYLGESAVLSQSSHWQQQHRHQRRLEFLREDDKCHGSIITSRATDVTTNSYGIVFALQNSGNEREIVSSLSVYLDTNNKVSYNVYVLDGMYVNKANDGTVINSAIGSSLDGSEGWEKVASGAYETDADLVRDNDGATLLPFSSFSNGGVAFQPGELKSFYLELSDTALRLTDNAALVGENKDDTVEVIDNNSMKLFVGRKVSVLIVTYL